METYLLYIAEWTGAVAVAMISGISLRFRRSKLVFKYPRREGIVALGVFIFTLAAAIILSTLAPFSILGLSLDLSGRLFLAAAGLVPVAVAIWRRKQPVRSAGWPRDKVFAALQLGLALAFLSIFLRWKFTALMSGVGTNEMALFGYLLAGTLLEETTFRGFIQPRLASWWGEIPGWLAASALSVICQLPRVLGSAEGWPISLGLIVAQALVAGFIMSRCHHVLSPALYRAVSDWLFYIN